MFPGGVRRGDRCIKLINLFEVFVFVLFEGTWIANYWIRYDIIESDLAYS